MAEITTKTVTKEEVLTQYNAEHGSNLTFIQLGEQLARKELQQFREKKLKESVVLDVVV